MSIGNKIFDVLRGLFTISLFLIVTPAFSSDFIVLGDMPYGNQPEVEEQYRALIERVNNENADFVIHLGDIKSGSTMCSDDFYIRQKQLFMRFTAPFFYTPGDNEWTDCHRANNGAYDPLDRLKKLRQVLFDESYFAQNASLGVQSQGDLMGDFSDYIENQMWITSQTVFLLIHVVGSNNNMDSGTPSGEHEFLLREKANKEWINKAFDLMQEDRISDLVVMFHGDPFVDWMMPQPSLIYPGFLETVEASLFEMAMKTDKKILIIHGDTHQYKWDHPFYGAGLKGENVSRLVVPGARDMRAVKISIQRTKENYYSHNLID
ncbi:metallophosphoesterase [Burkholderiales bacterium]|nr:metallophosphoesterase [Burkholderiales bacterium]